MASQRPTSQGIRRAKNGSITSFFKPVSQSQTMSASAPLSTPLMTPSTPLSPPPPSSLPPSCQSTPAKPAPIEIPASDESGSEDSDDSLQDLSVLIGRRPPPARPSTPPRPQQDPYATPRAKRIAVQFQPWPLTWSPKFKYDLKTLAEDARLDDATTASSIRAQEAAAAGSAEASASPDNVTSDEAFVEIVKERGGQDAQKVLRAVQRADPGASQQRYCFFATEYSRPVSRTAPKVSPSGPWRLLTEGGLRDREQHLASGLPQMVVRMTKALPDELLQWILDELCIQESVILREGYGHIVADCPDEQLLRLVTPQRLQELFVRLGARSEQLESPRVESTGREPYQDRDWSALQSFLVLLAAVSRKVSAAAVQFATQMLLAMSMDSFLLCNPDVFVRFSTALECLIDAIPGPAWDAFCFEMSVFLSAGDKSQSIRANGLLCLPLSSGRLHEMRRRLAMAFLFDEQALAHRRPEDMATIHDFIRVMDSPGFDINLQTDFAELKSRILILDMAIDDGSALALRDRQDEAGFNLGVDRLAEKLADMWRRINDAGMKLARTETKSVVEWVQQRLMHSVRTRKKIKKSVFDLAGQEDNAFELRRQQDYMSRFLGKA
ncbi:hypothetical protein GQ602_003458 [Ophiocordyceps camponoti-floridani]|uniref:Uncharacterized protein n=1 Tax=Ophiocordyceps camponoti-floridani TaxID=2030778 RepID=A0A8H4Q8M9_9HYPO|nr:hypothetical protein GQ602_003458 [Ophiocordyceps camponoti-floridani]